MQLLSSLTRKYLMALTGLGLVIFVILHLLGNVLLYFPHGEAFNAYALKLESLGALLLIAEGGLVGTFLVHILLAFGVTWTKSSARPIGYQMSVSKGGDSKNTILSRNMIITGVVLLVFVVLHIWHFKFGPGMAEGYVTEIKGEKARDLHRWVVESFQNGWIVTGYVAVMIVLGSHIRHGFWSAFQSLGLNYPKCSKPIYCFAAVLAVLLALGFLGIPIWIYLGLGGAAK